MMNRVEVAMALAVFAFVMAITAAVDNNSQRQRLDQAHQEIAALNARLDYWLPKAGARQ